MNRRKFFQTTALSGGLLAVPSLMSFLSEKTTNSNVLATGCSLKIRLNGQKCCSKVVQSLILSTFAAI